MKGRKPGSQDTNTSEGGTGASGQETAKRRSKAEWGDKCAHCSASIRGWVAGSAAATQSLLILLAVLWPHWTVHMRISLLIPKAREMDIFVKTL